MKRPSIPDELYETVEDYRRPYEKHWRETLERILEQDAGLEIKSIEVEA